MAAGKRLPETYEEARAAGWMTPDELLAAGKISKNKHEKLTHGGLSAKQYSQMIESAMKYNKMYREFIRLFLLQNPGANEIDAHAAYRNLEESNGKET